MHTFAAIASIETGEYQNAQELASIWGDVRTDLENKSCELLDAWVLLGERDVLMLFEAESREDALQASIAVQRYGLDLQTMEAIHVDDIGEIVDEV